MGPINDIMDSLYTTEKGNFMDTVERFHIQSVPGGMCQASGECSYVKVHRYNPKHLYPKLNGYGDNGQRNLKV